MKIIKNKIPISNFKSNGFTLIEIVMIIVIASIAIPTLLLLLGQQTKYGVDAEIRVTEINLAQELMEEIKTKCWDESKIVGGVCTGTSPGGDLGINAGETLCDPTTYDDVDDYRACMPSIPLGGINYTRTVQVCYVPSTDLNSISPCLTAGASATNYKRINVTVTDPNSKSVEIVTVVTNY